MILVGGIVEGLEIAKVFVQQAAHSAINNFHVDRAEELVHISRQIVTEIQKLKGNL